MPLSKSQGFTLIELSIVLVIIGLIVGGVLVGQDMIRSAEIRATVSQIEKYNSAVNTFRTKYNCLPGDCALAMAGQVGLYTINCGGSGSNWCANGDGLVEDGGYPSSGGFCVEVPAVWVHLSQASLIDFSPGIPASNTCNYNIPTAVPVAKLGRGNYVTVGSTATYNYWAITGVKALAGGVLYLGNYLTPIEASNIDNKLDDGMPNTGIVQARTNSTSQNDIGAFSPLADVSGSNAGSYSQTPVSGNCLAGGVGTNSTDPTDIYNVNVSNGGNAQACALRLRWN